MALATTTVVALAAIAASTAATLYSTDTQAKQAEANADYQAAQTAADAAAAKGAAEVEASRIRKAAKAQQAQATAQAAAAGIDVSSPTAVKINSDITKNAEEDAQLTILNGSDTSARMRAQSQQYSIGADLARKNGRQAQTGTLLSAAASAYGAGGGWKRAA